MRMVKNIKTLLVTAVIIASIPVSAGASPESLPYIPLFALPPSSTPSPSPTPFTFPPMPAPSPTPYPADTLPIIALPIVPPPGFTPPPETAPPTDSAALPEIPLPTPLDTAAPIPLPTPPETVKPTPPPTPLPLPTWAPPYVSAVVPAVDISTMPIVPMAHPQTTILSVSVPQGDIPAYIIRASSPISSVTRLLMEDNRLVLDIPYATAAFTGPVDVPPFLPVTGARMSQFEEAVTRVVFDLQDGARFRIEMSPDRTMIFLFIAEDQVTGVRFEAGENYDLLIIEGVRPSALRVQDGPPAGAGNLNIHIANAAMTVGAPQITPGTFVNSITAHAPSAQSGLLALTVNPDTTYTIFQSGPMETTVRFHAPTFRNIRYQNAVFQIARTDGFTMDISQIIRTDNYHQRQFILTLPTGAGHLGFGTLHIDDEWLQSLTIIPVDDDITHLIFDTRRILAFDVTETDNYYVIHAMHPRQFYDFIVVLDPGDGGATPGATRNGVMEKDLNLAVVLKARELLMADGRVRVYTTRDTDVAVALADRAPFGNDVGDIFIAVHHNAWHFPHVRGVETFYRPNDLDTHRSFTNQDLARLLHDQLVAHTGRISRRYRVAERLMVLRQSVIPAALIEVGFMSNPEEFAAITQPAYQWRAANAIFHAVIQAYHLYAPTRAFFTN